MKIGIVGAGGIGSFYAGLLSRAGHDVRVLARGEHLAAMQSRGLEVWMNGEAFVAHPEATADPARLAGCDHVLVAVKGYSLPEVAPALAAAAASGAAIVPMLNGVDAAGRLMAAGVPQASIVGGLVHASVARTAPGVVERRSTFDRIVLGELDRARRQRTTRLVEAIAATGAVARESDDIVHDLWRKFAFIVPMTVACGLSRQPMGPVLATERGRALLTRAVREIALVSNDVLTAEDAAAVRGDLFAIAPGIKPSFLLDLERGGPTELDMLAGTVSRLGRAMRVSTPVHNVATAAFEIASMAPRV